LMREVGDREPSLENVAERGAERLEESQRSWRESPRN